MVTPRSGLMRIELVGLPTDVPRDLFAQAMNATCATADSRLGIDELALPMRAEFQVFRL